MQTIRGVAMGRHGGFQLLALMLLLLAEPAWAQGLRWDMPTEYPRDSMPGAGIERFASQLNTLSHGQILVTPSYDAALGLKGIGLLRAIEAGQPPLGDSFAGPLGQMAPIFLLSSLPFVATSFEDALRLYQAAKPTYAAAFAQHHQRLLYATPWPPTGLWAKHPVLRPADLAGLTIRAYDETSRQVMDASGAKAVYLSFADAMPRLKDGSLQGVLSSGDGGAGRRLWDFLPSFTAINYAVPLSLASMNEATFDALPQALQQAVEVAARATEAAQWQEIRSRLDANYAMMRANRVEISPAPDPTLKQLLDHAAEGAITAWEAEVGPAGAAVLATYRAQH
ncbi:MAG TPA: TRAP transporter substrate-binding protein [Aliidongia sp.]|uniref:TRAP transporter substrate-binding protein n=1 Tax=Aliidongia sp. TaxID=1914230 RepID=UPI002DDD3D41|nr:TRAP transporter substrate-binding protein [Aliidongia sp.]HEV2676488.1 TRAP transporter substrate-binding protein [Aliidongia sp.]